VQTKLLVVVVVRNSVYDEDILLLQSALRTTWSTYTFSWGLLWGSTMVRNRTQHPSFCPPTGRERARIFPQSPSMSQSLAECLSRSQVETIEDNMVTTEHHATEGVRNIIIASRSQQGHRQCVQDCRSGVRPPVQT
jgi:hypothetical protein